MGGLMLGGDGDPSRGSVENQAFRSGPESFDAL